MLNFLCIGYFLILFPNLFIFGFLTCLLLLNVLMFRIAYKKH